VWSQKAFSARREAGEGGGEPVRSIVQPLVPSLLAVASGLLVAAVFLRFSLYPLAWIALSPLVFVALRAPTLRGAAWLGWIAGVSTNLPAFYWLVYTIRVFGGFPLPVALGLYAALTAFTALQFALFAALLHWARPRLLWGIVPAAFWVVLEYVYPNLFPWHLANSQMKAVHMIQSGDLAGPYLLSFAMVWFSTALALVAWRRDLRPISVAVVLAVAIWSYGVWRLPAIEQAMAKAPRLRVGLVQGNVGIEEKGDARFFTVNLAKYQRLSAAIQDQVDLLIWPETVHQYWIPTSVTALEGEANPFPSLRTSLIFGGLAYRALGGDEVEQLNSAFWMEPGGVLRGRYDKRILMPFGEYIPGGSYIPAVYALSPETGRFTAGKSVRVFDLDGKGKVGQLICFEDIIGSMPRWTTRAGAEVLATILNDAWYGDSAAPYQHQALAVWRAVENRRFLLRGSNTGVTSIVDAAGRVQVQGGLFTEEVVVGEARRLQLRAPYTVLGDWFPKAAALFLGLYGLLRKLRRVAQE